MTKSVKHDHVWGYDLIRCIAMLTVALRHLIGIHGYDPSVIPYFIGLPAFSALSGYLALRSRGTPFTWLSRRLARIYSSYHPLILISLLGAYLTGYKPVSLSLALSQFFGLATLTHPGKAIGTHTWFITFILLCYFVATLVRWRRILLWPSVALGLIASLSKVPEASLFFTFTLGLVIATRPDVRSTAAVIMLGLLVTQLLTHSEFLTNPVAGMASIFLGSLFTGARPVILAPVSRITYEFYLCHGVIYVLLERYAQLSLIHNLILGTTFTFLCANLLYWIAAWLRSLPAALSERTFPLILKASQSKLQTSMQAEK